MSIFFFFKRGRVEKNESGEIVSSEDYNLKVEKPVKTTAKKSTKSTKSETKAKTTVKEHKEETKMTKPKAEKAKPAPVQMKMEIEEKPKKTR